MPRTVEEEPLHKHTLHLFKGDFERLVNFYPDMPPSKALRLLLRSHLNMLEQRVQKEIPRVEVKL